jgi:macrolide-specific efflux system membrane fusion protein
MRVPRLSIPALRRSTLVNAGLAVLAVAGGVWAYFLVTANPNAAAAADTAGTRTVAVSQGEVTSTVSATGSIQSGNTASADFVTSGTVTSISVHVGDAVKKGQVLAQVDPTDSQDQLNTANANLNAAQASLTRANTGGDPATIASAQAQVTDAQATVDADQRALTGTTLTAPMAGTVTAINGSVGGSSGGGSSGSGGSGGSGGNGGGGGGNSSSSSSSSSSSGFIQLADLTRMEVTANFAEADATKLKTGQNANVSWAALTGATATGTVATIAPTATTSNNVNSYAVTVNLTTLPTGIRIGQTVTVVVTTADAQNAIRVPNAAVRTAGTRHTVTVTDGTTPQLVSVEVGVVGDTFTQITSGLTVGQVVVIVTTPSGTTNSNTGRFGGGGLGGTGGFGGGGLGGTGGFGGGGTGTTRTGTGTGGR